MALINRTCACASPQMREIVYNRNCRMSEEAGQKPFRHGNAAPEWLGPGCLCRHAQRIEMTVSELGAHDVPQVAKPAGFFHRGHCDQGCPGHFFTAFTQYQGADLLSAF